MVSLCLPNKDLLSHFHGFWGSAQSGPFPFLPLSHSRAPMLPSCGRAFTDTAPFLKSSSVTFPPAKSLLTFSLVAKYSQSSLLHLPERWNHFYSLSEHNARACFCGCNFTYVCAILLDSYLFAPLQIVNSLRTRTSFFGSLYGL